MAGDFHPRIWEELAWMAGPKGILDGEVASWGQSDTFSFSKKPLFLLFLPPWTHDQCGTLDYLCPCPREGPMGPRLSLIPRMSLKLCLSVQGTGPQWAASMVEQGDLS